MALVKAKHRTQTTKDGQPYYMTFEKSAWMKTWMPSGEWMFVEYVDEPKNYQAPAEVKQTAPTVKVKTGCCGGKK
jgi:hypothetical protein